MVLHVRIAKEKVKFDLKSIFFCRNFSKGRKIRKKFAKKARNLEREREKLRLVISERSRQIKKELYVKVEDGKTCREFKKDRNCVL